MTDVEIKKMIADAVNSGLEAGYSVGVKQGIATGLVEGEKVGFIKGIRFCQAALSEGTRKGSSECGKALKFIDTLEEE